MNILLLLAISSFYHYASSMTKDESEVGKSIDESKATETRSRRDENLVQNKALNYYPQMPEIPTSKLDHFRFKSRNVGGKKIAIVSFKADPDRDRRSILVPDAEGLLQPRPFAPLRHHHKFLPPFEDETLYSLNRSSAISNSLPFDDLTRDEIAEERTLNRIDNSLRNLQALLEDEEKIHEKRQLVIEAREKENGRREMSKKNKKKKKKRREKKKEKRKNKGEKKNKKRRKPRTKSNFYEIIVLIFIFVYLFLY
ncbi:hypothetical protein Avbf_12154, partial [Armadillidium vulgare]